MKTVYYKINHLLDFALHLGSDISKHAFRVPATPEARRFGLPPGRYLVLNGINRVVLAADQNGTDRYYTYPTLVLR